MPLDIDTDVFALSCLPNGCCIKLDQQDVEGLPEPVADLVRTLIPCIDGSSRSVPECGLNGLDMSFFVRCVSSAGNLRADKCTVDEQRGYTQLKASQDILRFDATSPKYDSYTKHVY